MKELYDILLTELWEEIYTFLDQSECCNFEKVCQLFRSICERVEKRKIKEYWMIDSKYLFNPLCEPPVKEEEIRLVEERMGIKLPFHLREFIKLTNGRNAHSDDLTNLHYNNSLKPFKTWRVGFSGKSIQVGGVYDMYDPTEIFVSLESGKMWMDLSTYGCSDTIPGGWMGFLRISSSCYDEHNPYDMEKLSENFGDLVKISRYNPSVVKDLPEKFKQDLEWMKKLAMKNPKILGYVSNVIRDDANFVRDLILRDASVYYSISDRLKLDKELFEFAISRDIENLLYAHKSLRRDKEMVLKYCKNSRNPSALEIPNDLLDNEVIYHFKFGSLPSHLRTPELALHFIKKHGQLDQDLRGIIGKDITIQTAQVLEAIYETDPEFLITLNMHHLFVFDEKDIALKLFKGSSKRNALTAFNLLPQSLQTDLDVIKAALKCDFKIYGAINEELKRDRDFLLPIWKETNSSSIILKSGFYEPFRKDFEFLRVACSRNKNLVFKIDRELVTEELLNSLPYYCYKDSSFEDIMNMSRIEHYQHHLKKQDL